MDYFIDGSENLLIPPSYTVVDLNVRSETIVYEYMREHLGGFACPIPTDVLIKIIERESSDLDLYADLSGEGDGVEGITYIFSDRKPVVNVAKSLSEGHGCEHDLRRTLAHELAHAYYHGLLWFYQSYLFDRSGCERKATLTCLYKSSHDYLSSDWAESQAEYAAGAILMPGSPLIIKVLQPFWDRHKLYRPLEPESDRANWIIAEVAEYFDVSERDASKRLKDVGFIKGKPTYSMNWF